MIPPKPFTTAKAAKIAKVNDSRIRQLIKAKAFKATMGPGGWWIDRESFDVWRKTANRKPGPRSGK